MSAHASLSGVRSHSCGPHWPATSHFVVEPGLPKLYVATCNGVELRSTDAADHGRDLAVLARASTIANEAWRCREDGEGCTFFANKDGSPERGYVSGVRGYETIFSVQADDSNDVYADCRQNDYPALYANVVMKLLCLASMGEGATVGCWIHGGKRYIDIGFVFDNATDCMDFAESNEQLAIYDLNCGVEIKV